MKRDNQNITIAAEACQKNWPGGGDNYAHISLEWGTGHAKGEASLKKTGKFVTNSQLDLIPRPIGYLRTF